MIYSTVLSPKEVLQYYVNKHQSVYAMMLNASKAFDRVQYVKLFIVLIRRGLWPIMVRNT